MTNKQKNIIQFIERNTNHVLGENSVSTFIGKYWGDAKTEYERSRNTITDREINLYNFAGDNGMNEYEAESALGMDYPMGGIHCADDM